MYCNNAGYLWNQLSSMEDVGSTVYLLYPKVFTDTNISIPQVDDKTTCDDLMKHGWNIDHATGSPTSRLFFHVHEGISPWFDDIYKTYGNSMMCIMHNPFSYDPESWVMFQSNPLSNDVYNTKLIVLDNDALKKCFALAVLETDVNNSMLTMRKKRLDNMPPGVNQREVTVKDLKYDLITMRERALGTLED